MARCRPGLPHRRSPRHRRLACLHRPSPRRTPRPATVAVRLSRPRRTLPQRAQRRLRRHRHTRDCCWLGSRAALVRSRHLRSQPRRPTNREPRRRTAKLLFTDERGRPFHDRRWSEHWTRWRDAARWPVRHGTFHALRHLCATTMLTNGVDPQHVQRALRHANLQHTLSAYIQWLPRSDRPTNVVSSVLRLARRL
ncbi:site-specific integrase [Virgisporangium aurantiacum]|uniref:site-specific integrase n=1 Tax=Virgisporangium aurantiacum TaxID=175570 RepID=UPI001EF31FD8|nr:site-specific integrase [Virgisporangium aurantiacum]